MQADAQQGRELDLYNAAPGGVPNTSRLIRPIPRFRPVWISQKISYGRTFVDIAVRVDESLTPEEIFDLRLKHIEALEDLLDRPVDVVIHDSRKLLKYFLIKRHAV